MVEANTKDSVPGIGNWPVFSKPVRGNHKAPFVPYAALASVAALAKKILFGSIKTGLVAFREFQKNNAPKRKFQRRVSPVQCDKVKNRFSWDSWNS